MAVKSAKTKSAAGKNSPSRGSKNGKGPKSAVIGVVIAVVCLVLGFEAVSLIKAPEVEKNILAQVVGQFSGTDQRCGKFGAWDIAAVGTDRVALTDQQNGRILFFDRSGKFLKAWGKKGEGADELKEPSGMGTGVNGDVYFIDAWKSAIIGINSKDKLSLTVPLTHGFYGPRGVAYDGTSFYVADTGTHRVVKVSPQGEILASFGASKQGGGKNEFNNPRSLKVDSKGNIYVADFENSRVQVLDSKGKFTREIKVGNKVTDVAVDAAGRIFASSMDGNFVKVYNSEGKYIGQLKGAQGSENLFRGVSGMGMTPDGLLLLAGNDLVSMVRVP
jgi:tripartite motif-containing protein 71